MTAKRVRSRIVPGCLVALTALLAGVVLAQTRIKPGFNLFSVAQDQEIGRQSAAEAERQLPILSDRSIEGYINAVGKRLAAVAPGANYPYQFKVVNTSDINAFALPGGRLYLNRGLIEAARSEGQLAGVMAHEMAHVALRDGTNQASEAYLAQAGLGVVGGLAGGKSSSTPKASGAVGGFGLDTLYLKFTRTDEEQADVVGAQMMAKAGYDPRDMVNFFEKLLTKRDRDPGKVEPFFSSHPAPQNRAARIRKEMKMLRIRPTQSVGGFQQARAELRGMPSAPSLQQIAQGQEGTSRLREPGDSGTRVFEMSIDRPSASFRSFKQRGQLFQVDYPVNWRVYEPANGYGVTIAPDGGYLNTGGEERNLISGVIVNHYDTFDSEASERIVSRGGSGSTGSSFADASGLLQSRTTLAQATNDLIRQDPLRTNPHLKMMPNSQRTATISGASALSLVLSGRLPATREEERVTSSPVSFLTTTSSTRSLSLRGGATTN